MALINWQEKYMVQIAEIDEQHQQLVDIINELYDAMLKGKGKNVLSDVFEQLDAYVKEHFRTEENLMFVYKYDDLDAHKLKHKEFIQQLSEFKADHQKGKRTISIEVVNFLKDWLLNHISRIDQEYAAIISPRMVKK